jgi:cytochrome c oxidase assembly protein subunit 15
MNVARTADFKLGLFLYCLFALVSITLLLFAGGFTTSIKAGMAFLDWPLSNGSINPEGWLTESDKFAEHSHRLLGMQIGLISMGLVLWTFLRESLAWVRKMAWALLALVVFQGLLGGARVLFDQLNTLAESNLVAQLFLVAHASGAMLVLTLLVSITFACSKSWISNHFQFPEDAERVSLKRLAWVAYLATFVQIFMGAVMRHADAGLAIARFPLANESSVIPAYWNFAVSIHFAHRVGALILTVLLLYLVWRLLKHRALDKIFFRFPILISVVLSLQVYLGALTIWTAKNPYSATMHHLVGAFLLATIWGITFILSRSRVSE